MGAAKPRVAMTTWRRTLPTFLAERTDLYTLGSEYPQALTDAGALVALLPFVEPADATRMLEGFDGLVLVGGDDVCPATYGAPDDGHAKGTDARADASDVALLRAAVDADLPVLAICRGLQIANVAYGGTLHADIADASDDPVHAPISAVPEEVMAERHEIEIEPGSWLAKAYGTTRRTVNSIHHQAIDRLADGFRPVAHAPDGTIEAIEPSDDRRIVAVQWHPEKITGEGDGVLFSAWVDELRPTS
jgi:putative glutamine amidotransferase